MVTKQPLIRSMRTVKRETLKLISGWVSRSNDPQMVSLCSLHVHIKILQYHSKDRTDAITTMKFVTTSGSKVMRVYLCEHRHVSCIGTQADPHRDM